MVPQRLRTIFCAPHNSLGADGATSLDHDRDHGLVMACNFGYAFVTRGGGDPEPLLDVIESGRRDDGNSAIMGP